MFSNRPKITVLMPVYNGETYLREAIESILAQSFRDFEFLIINDGSTDQSVSIIKSYYDPRIRQIDNDQNMGLVNTLNKGLLIAQGEYIARMDCDDISMPDRLKKQVEYMERHPNVGVCGTWIEWYGEEYVFEYPTDDRGIKEAMLSYCALAHPAVMFGPSLLKTKKIYYNSAFEHIEDYELWSRLAPITTFVNIPEMLLKYRIHPGQICRKYVERQNQLGTIIKGRMSELLTHS
jgi:glycosyltransferase involved in cell wall biosynthesis